MSISGIQHFVFCRRQWALIHIEQQWEENVLTVSGNIMHEKAHDNTLSEKRGDVIISRGMPVCSYELGINGVCDVVEFYKSSSGAILRGREGYYKILPLEYKNGEPKENDCDILQAAAQAMCLEDMFCTTVEEISIFYGKTKRRLKVPLSDELRARVRTVVEEMHTLYNRKYTPKVKTQKQCRACSLNNLCLPKLNKNLSVKEYIGKKIAEDTL